MKRFLALLDVCILGGLVFASNGLAQTATPDADHLFEKYRAAESRFGFAVSQVFSGIGIKEDGHCFIPFGDCPPLSEMFRLQEALKVRADAGDVNAMFYTAMLMVEVTEKRGKTISQREAVQAFDSAASYYKRAGDGGAIGGYWNVTQMYANGTGVVQSKSAAVEWFYKAGTAYLASGLREKALAALDAIKAIDIEHRLGKRLQAALAKGEPK